MLEVISRSAFDLQAVFETVAESSVRLCGADRAFIFRFDGELLRMAVAYNAPQQLKDFISQNPFGLAGTPVLAVRHLNGERSTLPMSWLILNLRTARKMSRQSELFSQYQYSKAKTYWAS